MTTESVILPPVTPAFADAVYRLAMQVGWRNCAKRIAFGATVEGPAVVSGNGHKRNGHGKWGRNGVITLAWWEKGHLRYGSYYIKGKDGPKALEYAYQRMREVEANSEAPWPWRAKRGVARPIDESDKRLNFYIPERCCEEPMGLCEPVTIDGELLGIPYWLCGKCRREIGAHSRPKPFKRVRTKAA